MKSTTKIQRANLALNVLMKHEGIPRTLGCWLQIFNQHFSSNLSFRSTKELAHMFRYIALNNKLLFFEKRKGVMLFDKVRTRNTLYTFKMEKEIIAPKIICEICNKEMNIVDQKHGKTKVVRLNYSCECGSKGVVLLEEEGTFDRYLYDNKGELLKYDNG
jgi:lysyl-tRNA synthetase class I